MKVLNILNHLHPSQHQNFDLFMRSPFFHIPEEVQQLYLIIQPYLQDGRLDEGEVTQIYSDYVAKYGQRSKGAFHKISHQFITTIEEFLKHDELRHPTKQGDQLLLESYSRFAEPKYFQQLMGQQFRQLDEAQERNATHYLRYFQLQYQLYYHPGTVKRSASAGVLLENAQLNLDRFFMAAKLPLAAELINRNNALAEAHQMPLLEEISALAKKEKSPVLNLYLLLIDLFLQPHKEASFKNLRLLFEEHMPLFSLAEQANIINFLITYSNQKFTVGNQKYLVHLFDLYKLFVSKKFHIDTGLGITDDIFLNIVIMGCLNKEFNFVYKFLQQNKKHLHPEHQQSVVHLSNAYLHFHQKEYEKAWTTLDKVHMSTWDFKTRARSLQIRCYYEHSLSHPDFRSTLNAQLTSFRKFIYRLPKRSENFKTKYYNKIKILRALSDFDPRQDQKKVFKEKWLHFMDSHPVTADTWVREKINAL